MDELTVDTDLLSSDTHAFIIRITCDGIDENGNAVAWHGWINHVGSSVRLYFQDLDCIPRFIIEQAGLKQNRLPRWLRLIFQKSFDKLKRIGKLFRMAIF